MHEVRMLNPGVQLDDVEITEWLADEGVRFEASEVTSIL